MILEPSPFYFDKLKSTYEGNDNIILVRNAIFEKNQDVIIFELNDIGLSNHPNWAAGIGSLNKDHLLKLKVLEHEIREVKVEGITFNNLLKKYPNFYKVD